MFCISQFSDLLSQDYFLNVYFSLRALFHVKLHAAVLTPHFRYISLLPMAVAYLHWGCEMYFYKQRTPLWAIIHN